MRSRSRRELATVALRTALRVRADAEMEFSSPLAVCDLVEQLGLELRFVDVGSLEGVYLAGARPQVLIAADRPAGRQAFTCGHELGHHVFRHGTRLDELVAATLSAPGRRPEELLADLFSGFLLMPKRAVVSGFRRRGWNWVDDVPEQYYVVAAWLGVGYTSLLNHMTHSLRIISEERAANLARVPLRRIRRTLAGRDLAEDLIVVDALWKERPVDLRVGDWLLVPADAETEGGQVERDASNPCLQRAARVGIGRLRMPDSGQSVFVRVSRNPYVGLARYRHLAEPDDE